MVVPFILEEVPVIFLVFEVLAHEMRHQFKELVDFLIAQARDHDFDEIVIGKFLQINHQGFFVHFAGKSEGYHSIVFINKVVLMLFHGELLAAPVEMGGYPR
jgi:hypothetical protein